MESWSGIKNATKFGNCCAQKNFMAPIFAGSDDCLFLNIYTTALKPIEPRAVMVCIHGGGFVCGSGDDDFNGPDYLIEKDIVLVSINYRLGILGEFNF